jgi:uncharacterized membrane protein
MEIDGNLLSGTQLWWLGALYAVAMFYAFRLAPWRRLLQKDQLNIFLGAVVVLIALWHLRGQIQPGLTFHLLGVTTVTLMFGWSLALMVTSLALLVVSFNAGYGWEGFVASVPTVILIPITLTQVGLVLMRSWLPKHFFIYVLGNGFFTAWLVAYVSGYVSVELLVMSGAYRMADLDTTIVPFFPMMFFPEAIINGWVITILVLFCPAWVHSFSDEQYINGK